MDTADEALALSLTEVGRVDLGYMSNLTGKPQEKIIEDLSGIIFRDPLEKASDGSDIYYAPDEYLSGNVRHHFSASARLRFWKRGREAHRERTTA